jgi:hypothetical protein
MTSFQILPVSLDSKVNSSIVLQSCKWVAVDGAQVALVVEAGVAAVGKLLPLGGIGRRLPAALEALPLGFDALQFALLGVEVVVNDSAHYVSILRLG